MTQFTHFSPSLVILTEDRVTREKGANRDATFVWVFFSFAGTRLKFSLLRFECGSGLHLAGLYDKNDELEE